MQDDVGTSSSEDECLAVMAFALTKRKRKHKMWVRSALANKEKSCYNLFKELSMWDHEMYFRYMRMSPSRFEHLLTLIAPKITKKTTNYREPIPPDQRLSLTLRHLATGESQISLSLQYRIGRQTISKITPETCKAISDALAPEYVSMPTSAEGWLVVSKHFQEKWDLPHVIGALDGKHIRIRCPNKTGSLYHNYKAFFSMVLSAVCDANYCFLMYDLGQYGSNNDSGVLKSKMGKQLAQENLNLPCASTLEDCAYDPLPYFLVGDEIFTLKTYLMRPYPGSQLNEEKSVYNYRHSRCRRVIENAFGILVARWRIFDTPIQAKVENVETIVMATIA